MAELVGVRSSPVVWCGVEWCGGGGGGVVLPLMLN